jgi:hypothetical protein
MPKKTYLLVFLPYHLARSDEAMTPLTRDNKGRQGNSAIGFRSHRNWFLMVPQSARKTKLSQYDLKKLAMI